MHAQWVCVSSLFVEIRFFFESQLVCARPKESFVSFSAFVSEAQSILSSLLYWRAAIQRKVWMIEGKLFHSRTFLPKKKIRSLYLHSKSRLKRGPKSACSGPGNTNTGCSEETSWAVLIIARWWSLLIDWERHVAFHVNATRRILASRWEGTPEMRD